MQDHDYPSDVDDFEYKPEAYAEMLEEIAKAIRAGARPDILFYALPESGESVLPAGVCKRFGYSSVENALDRASFEQDALAKTCDGLWPSGYDGHYVEMTVKVYKGVFKAKETACERDLDRGRHYTSDVCFELKRTY